MTLKCVLSDLARALILPKLISKHRCHGWLRATSTFDRLAIMGKDFIVFYSGNRNSCLTHLFWKASHTCQSFLLWESSGIVIAKRYKYHHHQGYLSFILTRLSAFTNFNEVNHHVNRGAELSELRFSWATSFMWKLFVGYYRLCIRRKFSRSVYSLLYRLWRNLAVQCNFSSWFLYQFRKECDIRVSTCGLREKYIVHIAIQSIQRDKCLHSSFLIPETHQWSKSLNCF